ncbi:MAG: DUF2846 domain-containing protein [Hyphomicrobiaceae bacterium]|nr:DUF2846 domain-containing protein [Hyphomicrobiaceae bacterium]
MKIHALLIPALAILLGACGASGPQFTSALAKPDGNRALVFVYRTNTIIGIINPDVPFIHIDGKRLTRIRIGGYLRIAVPPGRHQLTTTESLLGNDTGRVRGETTFTLPAGATLYLRYTEAFSSIVPIVLPGMVVVISTGDFRFEPVPETEALAELAKTSALGPEARPME